MSCLVAIGIVGPKRNISLGPDWSRLEQAGLGQVAWSDSALRSQPGGLEEVRALLTSWTSRSGIQSEKEILLC